MLFHYNLPSKRDFVCSGLSSLFPVLCHSCVDTAVDVTFIAVSSLSLLSLVLMLLLPILLSLPMLPSLLLLLC